MDFVDIDKNLNNGQNMAGIAQIVYYGAWEDVVTWPAVPNAPATIEENGTLTGDIEMAVGKKMHSIYVTDDTGEFVIEPVGEADGKSFITKVSFFNPGLKAKILGFLNYAKNENLVFIVKDNDGQFYLMGDVTRPATYVGAPDGSGTGKETSGRRGVTMEFQFKCANVYTYTGAIPLEPAV